MKILHIAPTYLPAYRYGGPIKSVHELNKWLVKQEAEVTVYTTNIDGPNNLDVPLNKEVIIDGVKVYYFPITFRPWQYSCAMHKKLRESVKKFDLIHITSVFLSASTLGAYYARKFGKPYVISPRGSLMLEPLSHKKPLLKKIYIDFIEKRNLKEATLHFTVAAEKDEYLKSDLPLEKAIIIPNGFDAEEFSAEVPRGFFRQKFSIGTDKKIILFLSRLSWKKGLDTLIPAFYRISKEEPKTILIIAGPDDEGYGKNIKYQISNLKIDDKVIFTGMISGQDRIGAFRDSDVFVLPSYSENFGQVVLEAMHFGLPVVITKNVGISSFIARAGAGLVIEKDENQLAKTILKVLNNKEEAQEMGGRGRNLVKKEFSWPQIAKKFIEEYNNLIINN